MKYDKTVWKKNRNTYDHISGKVSIRPIYSNIGQGEIVGYKIFVFENDGIMRACKWTLDGEKTLADTMKKAIDGNV